MSRRKNSSKQLKWGDSEKDTIVFTVHGGDWILEMCDDILRKHREQQWEREAAELARRENECRNK